jgi:hypothetical protein
VEPVPVSEVHSKMALCGKAYTVARAGVEAVNGGEMSEQVGGRCGCAAAGTESEREGLVGSVVVTLISHCSCGLPLPLLVEQPTFEFIQRWT